MTIAAYGTLRRGGRLQHYLGDKAEYLGTETIEGWDMFSLGSYPYIREGEGTITVDLFDVPVDEFIRTMNMELGAGYDMRMVDMEGFRAYLFIAPQNSRFYDGKHVKVDGGDWIKNIKKLEGLYEGISKGR